MKNWTNDSDITMEELEILIFSEDKKSGDTDLVNVNESTDVHVSI